jgi:RNA polymerase sigma-70 factor (ECF subfamily)
MHEQEQELVRQVLAGDRAALEALVLRYQQAVYGFLRARMVPAGEAEDLTQEVFLRFYLTRERFDESQAILPWLIGIARNLLKEFARKSRRRRKVEWTELCLEIDSLTEHEDEWEQRDQVLKHLPGCLDELGPSARQAIQFHYTENLRLAEISQRLKRSEGAIKLLMFRARQALKHCLQGKQQA